MISHRRTFHDLDGQSLLRGNPNPTGEELLLSHESTGDAKANHDRKDTLRDRAAEAYDTAKDAAADVVASARAHD
jgi:hypothetical protein